VNGKKYRYGFNGQEKDNEIAGEGNIYTAEFWQYDSRLGRRWNMDPRPNPSQSVYVCFGNNPIWLVDLYGDTISVNGLKNEDGNLKDAAKTNVTNQVNDGVFAVFGHSSSKGITFQIGDNKEVRCKNAKEFNAYMYENCKEWKDAIDNGTKITLVLYSCNAASNEYYDNHFGKGVITTEVTIAQDISKFLHEKNKESVVNALDGYGVFSSNGGKFIGARQQKEKKVENTFEGGFVTIINGEKKYKKVHAFTGKSKPKIGAKKPIL
jgi:hypothetical protein